MFKKLKTKHKYEHKPSTPGAQYPSGTARLRFTSDKQIRIAG